MKQLAIIGLIVGIIALIALPPVGIIILIADAFLFWDIKKKKKVSKDE